MSFSVTDMKSIAVPSTVVCWSARHWFVCLFIWLFNNGISTSSEDEILGILSIPCGKGSFTSRQHRITTVPPKPVADTGRRCRHCAHVNNQPLLCHSYKKYKFSVSGTTK